jgi:hypothetical protein
MQFSSFNLPPTQIAKPLPVTSISKRKQELSKGNGPKGHTFKGNASKGSAAKGNGAKGGALKGLPEEGKKSRKRKRQDDKKDDVPRAFKKLMAFADGKKPRAGLDDGIVPPKKKKAQAESSATTETAKQTERQERDIPTIRPGERLSEFAARVDAALPLAGLVTKTVKNGKDVLGLKVPRTRKEKKMHKLYDQWREEERVIQEKREEELEQAEEEEMENDNLGVKWRLDMEDEAARGKKKKKGKKGKYLGEAAGKEEDPWEELKRKRGEPKIGLHDVAKAPPELKPPTAKLLVRGAAVNAQDIPKAAGSLQRREELQGLRNEVVASYRKLMSEKRSVLP